MSDIWQEAERYHAEKEAKGAKHTAQELKELQTMDLDAKLLMTRNRIKEWVEYYGVDGIFVSFSGGKDSTVLLDIVRQMYPNVPAVFCDTGLEYPEVRELVKTFDNVTIVRPKSSFYDVITTRGYPVISKEVSECVEGARNYLRGKGGGKLLRHVYRQGEIWATGQQRD